MAEENTAEVMTSEVHDIVSLLSAPERDFLLRNNGDQVMIDTLKSKKLGLYFSASWCGPCHRFTPILAEAYEELRAKGDFEVVFISADREDGAFNEYFSKMPWLAIPFTDSGKRHSLDKLFKVRGIPHLVIIDEAGRVTSHRGVEIVREYGAEAYPFTLERIKELKDKEEDARRNQTLKSILVHGSRDFVLSSDGSKVPVADLVGKNILLYFSAHWCPPCRAFLPKLIEAYREIKSKDDAFEVIFISSDRNQASFEDFFSGMPWLALPFGDPRKSSLSRKFKVSGIPTVVALGPTGRTVTSNARGLIMNHGADAYPFTEEHVKKLEAKLKEMVKGWPEKLKHMSHDHELVLSQRMNYVCDVCEEGGQTWSYLCKDCDFDLHPKCAFKEEKAVDTMNEDANPNAEETHGGSLVCDGDVCRKA